MLLNDAYKLLARRTQSVDHRKFDSLVPLSSVILVVFRITFGRANRGLVAWLVEVGRFHEDEPINRYEHLVQRGDFGIPRLSSPRAEQGQAYLAVFVQIWVKPMAAPSSGAEENFWGRSRVTG